MFKYKFRLFQRRSSLRVKNLLEQQQQSKNQVDEDDDEENSTINLTDESKYRFLIKKQKDQETREKNRDKLQQDRAFRAQRRLEAKKTLNIFTK